MWNRTSQRYFQRESAKASQINPAGAELLIGSSEIVEAEVRDMCPRVAPAPAPPGRITASMTSKLHFSLFDCTD